MDGSTTYVQIILILFFLILSAFFSATETAFSSLNRTRLKNLAEHGNKRAAHALALSDRYDELLSTILIGNNIVNIGMASIGTILFVKLVGSGGVTLSTAVITVIVLIFGEITPKSIAKEIPEKFAMAVSPILHFLIRIFKPANFLFAKWKEFLRRVFRFKKEDGYSQDELLTIVEEAEQGGGMDAEESELVKSAIEFRDLDVSDILTPRVKVEGLPVDSTSQETADLFEESGYSRLPVYEDTIDHIIGIVHQKDYVTFMRKNAPFSLRQIMKKPVFVTPTAKLSDTLRLLQKKQSQLAVVADEYGGTVGIVSMEDILEELVGEIWDEHDEVEEAFRLSPDGNECLVLGSAAPDDLFELLDIDEETEASTVGGWVTEMVERIPAAGDSFECGPWHAEITKADERLVLEVRFTRLPASNDP